MYIINTRPQKRADHLTQGLMQAGFTVKNLPLLELQALALNDELKSQYEQFQDVEYVVVVSPTAATLGFENYLHLGYQHDDLLNKKWIAVGKKTQQSLAKVGIKSIVPEVETSEGMLGLDVFQSLNQCKIAFWRGIGGRTFMMEQLIARGCDVLNMLLYKRCLPPESEEKFNEITPPALALISSEQSWHNWSELAKKHRKNVSDYSYIVLGDRVTALLQQSFSIGSKKTKISTVYELNVDNILLCIRQHHQQSFE